MLKKITPFIKQRWFLYLSAYVTKFFLQILLRTCRIEVEGLDNFIFTAQRFPCILMLWHNRLPIVAEILNHFAPQFCYTAFISKSKDAEPLAVIAKSYKRGKALRVAHNARHMALTQMIRALKTEKRVLLITPDGPSGPQYIAKPGVIVAAKKTAAKIVPFSWNAEHVWRLKTWDQMMIPKPFTKIKVVFGKEICFGKEKNDDLKKASDLLKHLMPTFF